jgi:hypothetical protein
MIDPSEEYPAISDDFCPSLWRRHRAGDDLFDAKHSAVNRRVEYLWEIVRFGVNRVTLAVCRSLPVFPNKRTFSGAPPCLNGAISGQPVAAELWTSVTDLQPEAW